MSITTDQANAVYLEIVRCFTRAKRERGMPHYMDLSHKIIGDEFQLFMDPNADKYKAERECLIKLPCYNVEVAASGVTNECLRRYKAELPA